MEILYLAMSISYFLSTDFANLSVLGTITSILILILFILNIINIILKRRNDK